MNLLDYVSNFRHRLSSACDLARHNLQTSQSEMKLRYDKCARQTFQTRCYGFSAVASASKLYSSKILGPYTIEKKLSDLNYIVHTPGWRKQKQLCHINMLQEYFDRNSPPIAISVVINILSYKSVEEDFENDNKESNSAKLENICKYWKI